MLKFDSALKGDEDATQRVLPSPPGWYANPDGSPTLRWWDGERWSDVAISPMSPAAAGHGSPDAPRTNGLAIASLVCSCAAWLFLFLPAIPGVVLGFAARSSIRRSRGAERGNGLALAGIIVGCVMVVSGIFAWIGLAQYASLQGPEGSAPPFTETFSSGDHRFPSWQESNISADARNGIYEVEARDTVFNIAETWWSDPIPRVGVRAEATLSANSATGLALRGDDENDLYLFEVSSDKTWTVGRLHYEPYRYDELASGQDQAIALDRPLGLALEAQHQGDKTALTVWVGNQRLSSVGDAGGIEKFTHVGLTFRSEAPPSTFAVDNVVVTPGSPPGVSDVTLVSAIRPGSSNGEGERHDRFA